MTNRSIHIGLVLLLTGILFSGDLMGQIINLQLKIEPELQTQVLSDLSFGQVVSNAGLQNINLGDPNMGIFSIKAYRNQRIFINLQAPPALTNSNPAIETNIPIELIAAVNNLNENDFRNTKEIPPSGVFVDVFEGLSGRPGRGNPYWSTLYVYVYGTINVGAVPAGYYEADIILSVEYE